MNESARKQNVLIYLVSLHVLVELALPLDRLVDHLVRRLLDGPGAHPVPLLPHLPRLVDGLPPVGVLEDGNMCTKWSNRILHRKVNAPIVSLSE